MLRSVRGRLSRLTPANFGQSLAAARGFRSTVPVSPRAARRALRAGWPGGVAIGSGGKTERGLGGCQRGGQGGGPPRGGAGSRTRLPARLGSAPHALPASARAAPTRTAQGPGPLRDMALVDGSFENPAPIEPSTGAPPNPTVPPPPPPPPQALAAVPYDKLTIGVPKETFPLERRVAQSPESVKKVGGSSRGPRGAATATTDDADADATTDDDAHAGRTPTDACIIVTTTTTLHPISSPMRASTSR